MKRVLEVILCIFVGVFLFGIIAMTIQVIGEDSPNKATIIGGLLSMIGGAIGALSAYLIARMQLTKQLDRQDKIERKRILLEIKMKKAEEAIEILQQTRSSFFELQGAWTTYVYDHLNYIANRSKEKVDYTKFSNKALMRDVQTYRDKFINTYVQCYKFKSHFKKLISDIEEDHIKYFKDLTLDINDLLMQFSGAKKKYNTYVEMFKDNEPKIIIINDRFEFVYDKISEQINSFENELSNLYESFEQG